MTALAWVMIVVLASGDIAVKTTTQRTCELLIGQLQRGEDVFALNSATGREEPVKNAACAPKDALQAHLGGPTS